MAKDKAQPAQVLDLDELYGKDTLKAIKVRWDGREFVFRNLAEFGPAETMKLQELHRKFSAAMITRPPKNATPAQLTTLEARRMNELETLVDDSLKVICPDLADVGMPFGAKMNAFSFYFNQVNPNKAKSAKKK